MRVHMLGNVLGPIFVYATGLISVSMILAAGLSFLGLGTKPPEPEWGLMLNTLRTAIYVNPWVAALPGAMIFAVDLLQPAQRRHAQRHGHQELTR
jgi:peptide/nickel transport system permease protein